MAFMEPEISEGLWYEVETDNGTEFIPADVVPDLGIEVGQSVNDWSQDPRWTKIHRAIRDYCESTPHEVKLISGFGARLSATGYMDCTPWCVFATEQEADDYLRDEFGDDADDEPSRTHYLNGDEISLTGGCDGCSPCMVNGVLCHEHGCPDAWRDQPVACFECGCDFLPSDSGQRTCPDCLQAECDDVSDVSDDA